MTVSNALDDTFRRAREAGKSVLIPYLSAGFPAPEVYVDTACAALDAGADLLEIGIPFSDPLLDGPVVQHAQQVALDAGVTPRHCLRYAAEISERTGKPLLFMGAYNPIVAYGIEHFCETARDSGAAALIVPDLPVEEQDDLAQAASAAGLHLIQLVAPTSTPERLTRVCERASGFVYCVSVAGVTGARTGVAALAQPLVERLRGCSNLPVAVGFGIASPEDARAVGAFADGVIVGSALVLVSEDGPVDEAPARVDAFVAALRRGLDRAG